MEIMTEHEYEIARLGKLASRALEKGDLQFVTWMFGIKALQCVMDTRFNDPLTLAEDIEARDVLAGMIVAHDPSMKGREVTFVFTLAPVAEIIANHDGN